MVPGGPRKPVRRAEGWTPFNRARPCQCRANPLRCARGSAISERRRCRRERGTTRGDVRSSKFHQPEGANPHALSTRPPVLRRPLPAFALRRTVRPEKRRTYGGPQRVSGSNGPDRLRRRVARRAGSEATLGVAARPYCPCLRLRRHLKAAPWAQSHSRQARREKTLASKAQPKVKVHRRGTRGALQALRSAGIVAQRPTDE